jgi:hypothetical protein
LLPLALAASNDVGVDSLSCAKPEAGALLTPIRVYAVGHSGAAKTVEFWAAKNGCGTPTTSAEHLAIDARLADDETKVEAHACTSCAAELRTIAGGSQAPRFQPTWAGLIYGFLEAHPKP